MIASFFRSLVAFIRREPLIIGALVQGIITFLVAFGVPITPHEKVATIGLAGIVITIIVRWNTVSAPTSAARVQKALYTPVPGNTPNRSP